MRTISLVIPTYNEKENLIVLVRKIDAVLKKNYKILVVDDNSPDGTAEEAERLAKKYPVVVIKREGKLGYGSAIITGFKKALELNSGIIITLDADLSHNPKHIPVMLNRLGNYDVVIGSRKIKGGKIVGWSLWRHFCSNGANLLSRSVLGLKTRDVTSGFRAYKPEVIKKLGLDNIKSDGYSFLEEIIYMIEKNNFKIKEIPIVFLDRRKGKSKLSKKEIVKFFITIFRLFKLKLEGKHA